MQGVIARAARLAGAVVLACLPATASSAGPAPLGVADCVRIALEDSPRIDEAEARVREWQARLAEVESLYWPKLIGLGYVAPMYTVRGDQFHYETRWKRLKDWGPYTHLEALLAQPLYSFGRIEAGERAARERTEVEKARVREVRNAVALEVKRFYYMRLYALSMLPSLSSAADTVKSAIEHAEEAFEQGTGEATQTDIAKLRYAQSEVEKYLLIAANGAELAAAALKHTMGLGDGAPLALADETMPEIPDAPEVELAKAIFASSQERPEWTEITNGKQAAIDLAQAERLANAPIIFAAGMITLDWTPQRDPANNPYVYDPYNRVVGGVGVGLQFNLDPALAKAKAEGAGALGEEVDALARFAKTGIPLQVKKAHADVVQDRKLVEIADRGVAAAKKWLAFAAAAYTTGTGEARDVLEGLAAYVQARRGYFETVQSYFIARAELDFAIGRP
jgi:outer membrane protein TolC